MGRSKFCCGDVCVVKIVRPELVITVVSDTFIICLSLSIVVVKDAVAGRGSVSTNAVSIDKISCPPQIPAYSSYVVFCYAEFVYRIVRVGVTGEYLDIFEVLYAVIECETI